MLKELHDLVSRMATVNRYSDTKLILPESLLEHTGYVAIICLYIAQDLNEKIDYRDLMSKALFHDIEETISGDVIRPTKYGSMSLIKAFKDYGEACAIKALEIFPDSSLSRFYWDFSKTGKEGIIVSVADKLAVVYKMEQELSFGNEHFMKNIDVNEIVDGLMTLIPVCKSSIVKHRLIIELIEEGITICKNRKEYT